MLQVCARGNDRLTSYPPPSLNILELPTELILKILQLALLSSKVGVISAISNTIRDYVNDMIYKVVVLDSKKVIDLLYRTSKSNHELLTQVKKLVVTWDRASYDTAKEVQNIILQCTHIHALELPLLDAEYLPDLSNHKNLTQVTALHLSQGNPNGRIEGLRARLTHLRIAEPYGFGWMQPAAILATFADPPHLTHLEFSRRVNANEENDVIFAEDIKDILQSSEMFPALQVLVVSVFKSNLDWKPSPVEDSVIWKLLEEVKGLDSRFILVQGEKGNWKDEWKQPRLAGSGRIQSKFWTNYSSTRCR